MMNKKFIEILLKIELSLLGVLISCLIFFVILVTFNNQKFEIDWTIILNAASVMVLLGTMIFIAGQTEATKKSVECQIMPSIEMFMIHDREGGNSFAFYNLSSVPGIINFSLSFQQNQEACELKYENENISYRIPPQGVLITANTFFVKNDESCPKSIEIKEGVLVKIKAEIVPDLDNISKGIKRTYKKVYEFKNESHPKLTDRRWNEKTIGFPDILLFKPENVGLKQSVDFVVRDYMEKGNS